MDRRTGTPNTSNLSMDHMLLGGQWHDSPEPGMGWFYRSGSQSPLSIRITAGALKMKTKHEKTNKQNYSPKGCAISLRFAFGRSVGRPTLPGNSMHSQAGEPPLQDFPSYTGPFIQVTGMMRIVRKYFSVLRTVIQGLIFKYFSRIPLKQRTNMAASPCLSLSLCLLGLLS